MNLIWTLSISLSGNTLHFSGEDSRLQHGRSCHLPFLGHRQVAGAAFFLNQCSAAGEASPPGSEFVSSRGFYGISWWFNGIILFIMKNRVAPTNLPAGMNQFQFLQASDRSLADYLFHSGNQRRCVSAIFSATDMEIHSRLSLPLKPAWFSHSSCQYLWKMIELQRSSFWQGDRKTLEATCAEGGCQIEKGVKDLPISSYY